MSDYPKVWILLQTYERTGAATTTARSLVKYLKYPSLHYHICDDGSRAGHVEAIANVIREGGYTVSSHSMDRGNGFDCNMGGSMNRGIKIAHDHGADIHMMILDDWSLKWPLDIKPHVDTLIKYPETGMIRYSYVVPGLGALTTGFHCIDGHGDHYYLYWRLIRNWCIKNTYGKTDPYLVSMMAWLAHYRFFEAYGWIPEKLPPGETEVKMIGLYNSSSLGEDGPQILVPIGYCYGAQDSYFANIAARGDAYAEHSKSR